MPWGLTRYHHTGQSHFVTFCCYHRHSLFTSVASRRVFENAIERVRRSFRLRVYGYVVMPEHVHLLVSEPERTAPLKPTPGCGPPTSPLKPTPGLNGDVANRYNWSAGQPRAAVPTAPARSKARATCPDDQVATVGLELPRPPS